jgi:hypothetical protein
MDLSLKHYMVKNFTGLIMEDIKYSAGTRLCFLDPQSGESFEGVVVENYKFGGDICVNWDTGLSSSYDKDWLDKFTSIVRDRNIDYF